MSRRDRVNYFEPVIAQHAGCRRLLKSKTMNSSAAKGEIMTGESKEAEGDTPVTPENPIQLSCLS
jgi:hypothetical protein